ncbi:MAG: hypothetical protein KKA55_00760 [Proteobacteria bacterium]|nr:hypothetical protein [Pseudomonadota bacterium]MBU1594047.1 hypothetical protein [Pseudomonadota bacterium]
MLREMIAEPDVRADLAVALAVDAEFEDIRARIVARHLDGLPPGRRVLLSGCGSVSRRLAVEHGASLARHRVVFTDGSAQAPGGFHGHALLPAPQAVAADPQHALLMTCTYESAMRGRLSGLPGGRISALRQIVRDYADDADRLEAMRRIQAEADRLVPELERCFAPGDKTLCLIEPDLCGANLSLLKELRRQGWRVALLARRNAQISRPIERLAPEGFVDWLHQAPSFEALRLLAPRLLARYAFGLALVPVFHVTLGFVARCVGVSAGPVVTMHDTFLSQILEDRGFAEVFLARYGLDEERVEPLEHVVLTGAAGMLHRHPEHLNERYGARHGCRIKALKVLHPIDPVQEPLPERYSVRSGRPHVVSIVSLYTDPLVTVHMGYPLSCILEPIERLTAQGVHFTVINPMDLGSGHDFDQLRELAAANPLFEYHGLTPYDTLMERLPAYDFGWMCRRIDRVEVEYTRTHLPFAVFAFLEARVPVLASPETEYLASIVADNGIGLALPTDQWPRAGELLRNFDRSAYHRAADAFAEELSTARLAGRMAAFFDEIRSGDRTSPAQQEERRCMSCF